MQLKNKRLISLFLVFMMILTSLPITVFGVGYTNGSIGTTYPKSTGAGSADYSKLTDVTMWGLKITGVYAPVDEAKSDFLHGKFVYRWEDAVSLTDIPIYIRGSHMYHNKQQIVPQYFGRYAPFFLVRQEKNWNSTFTEVGASTPFRYVCMSDITINQQDIEDLNNHVINKYYANGIAGGDTESNIKMQDFLNRIMDMENPGSGTQNLLGTVQPAKGSLIKNEDKNIYKSLRNPLTAKRVKLLLPGLTAGVTDGEKTSNNEYLKSFYQNPYILNLLFWYMNEQNRLFGYSTTDRPILSVDDYLMGKYGDSEQGAYKIFIEPCMYRRYDGAFAVMTYQELAAQHRQVNGNISKSLAKNFGPAGVGQIANSMFLERPEECMNINSGDLYTSYSESLLDDATTGLGMWVISSPEVWKQTITKAREIDIIVKIVGVNDDGSLKYEQLRDATVDDLPDYAYYTEKSLETRGKYSGQGYVMTGEPNAITNVPIVGTSYDIYDAKNGIVGVAILNDVITTNVRMDSTTTWDKTKLPTSSVGSITESNVDETVFGYVLGMYTNSDVIEEIKKDSKNEESVEIVTEAVKTIFKLNKDENSTGYGNKMVDAVMKLRGKSVKEAAIEFELGELALDSLDLNHDGRFTDEDVTKMREKYNIDEDYLSTKKAKKLTYYDETFLGSIDREEGVVYIPENEDGTIDTSVPNTVVYRYILYPTPQQINVVEKVYPSGKKSYVVCDPVDLQRNYNYEELWKVSEEDWEEFIDNEWGAVIIQKPVIALPESAGEPTLVEWVTDEELPFKNVSNGVLPIKDGDAISGTTIDNIKPKIYPSSPCTHNLYVKWRINMPYEEPDPSSLGSGDPSGHGSGLGSAVSVSDKVPEWRLSKYNSSIASLVTDPSKVPYACMNLNLTTDETTHATSTLTPSGKYNFKTINPNGQETASSNTTSNMSMNSISNGYLGVYNSTLANTTFHSKAVPKSSPSITHSLTSAYVTMDGIVNMIKSTATSGLVAAQWQTNESTKNGLSQHNISTAYVPNSSVSDYSKIGLLRYGVYNKDSYTHERSIYYHYYCGGKYCSGHCGCYTTPEYRYPSGVSYYTGNYNLTTSFDRYVPQSYAALTVAPKLTEENAYTSYSYQSGASMKVYPEYGMLFANDNGEESIKWVVGDKAREIKPVFYQTLRFKTYVQPNSTGSSVATDSRALTAKNKFNNEDKKKQVIYKGAGVNTAFQLYRDNTKNNASLLTVKTFALDYNDSLGVQNAWGMNGYKPEDEHAKLVNSINNDKATAYEKLFMNNDGATYNGGVKQQQTKSFVKAGETVFTHQLLVRGGHLIGIKLNGESNFISIEQLKSKAGYLDVYQALIESKLYNESHDKSQTVFNTFEHKSSNSDPLTEQTYADKLNAERNVKNSGLATPDYAKINVGDNWYSEDTTVLVLKEYVTNFNVPSISFSDKLSLQITGLNTPINKTEFFNKMARGHIYLKYELPIDLPNGTKTKAYFEYDSLNNPQMSSRIEITDRSLGYQGAAYLVPNVSITDTTRQ